MVIEREEFDLDDSIMLRIMSKTGVLFQEGIDGSELLVMPIDRHHAVNCAIAFRVASRMFDSMARDWDVDHG